MKTLTKTRDSLKKIENDNIVLAQLRQGDKRALEYLFSKYFTRLCNFAYNLTRSETLAKEAVQQVFINVWEKRNKLYIETSLIAYLVKATQNNALNLIKKNKIRLGYEQDYAREHLAAHREVEAQFEGKAFNKLVKAGIKQLPAKCKEIYTLSKREGLTYEEIAAHLGVSPKTVENQMGIAMKKLREYLKTQMKTVL